MGWGGGRVGHPGRGVGPLPGTRAISMADLILRAGSRTETGLRSNNEDRFIVDEPRQLFLVADGMGGQDLGEQASGLAAEVVPRGVAELIAAHGDAPRALRRALAEANDAVIHAGRHQ